jgi:hypothetical protein
MLYLCLFLSALLLVVVNAVAISQQKPRVGIGLATLLSAAAAPLFCMMLLLPFFNAILVALAGLVCCVLGARLRWFLISSLGVTAAAYGCVALESGVPEVRDWDRLKAEYPMESVAPRLAYEDRPRSGANTASYQAERVSSLEKRFEEAEHNFTTGRRVRSLERLHAGAVTQFVNSPGFGPVRMVGRPTPAYVEMSDPMDDQDVLGVIPQPSRAYFSPTPEPGTVRIGDDSGLDYAHETNLTAFLNPFDFGYARDREHVVGFRSHRFHRYPDAPQRWKVERLELVGLLKYDDPVVYLSEHLPAMDELRDKAATRPLDAFESEALAGLRRGEDLMVQDRPDRMRVLGSIRAVKQCLGCHHAERGDLLGAFSYRLAREGVKD